MLLNVGLYFVDLLILASALNWEHLNRIQPETTNTDQLKKSQNGPFKENVILQIQSDTSAHPKNRRKPAVSHFILEKLPALVWRRIERRKEEPH